MPLPRSLQHRGKRTSHPEAALGHHNHPAALLALLLSQVRRCVYLPASSMIDTHRRISV
jgi:hypothetical protein